MTLKHGTMGKWVKKQLARGHKDPVVSSIYILVVLLENK